jgi:hypothetical protein
VPPLARDAVLVPVRAAGPPGQRCRRRAPARPWRLGIREGSCVMHEAVSGIAPFARDWRWVLGGWEEYSGATKADLRVARAATAFVDASALLTGVTCLDTQDL